MTKRSPKTQAREYAFKFLYALFLDKTQARKNELKERDLKDCLREFDQSYFEPDQEHPSTMMDEQTKTFAMKLIEGTLTNEESLSAELNETLHNWKSNQLDKVDFTVLLMALYEMKHFKETPAKVIMNEAINLSKAYGGNDSSSFINGLLDKLAKKNEE